MKVSLNTLKTIISEELEAAASNQAFDKEMIDLLSLVTTFRVGMSDVPDYKIRLRKNSIVFQFDPFDMVGVEGAITMEDLSDKARAAGLPAVAKWMLDHGAKKIKPQKRTFPRPYMDYD